jgi:hypothetical protein
MEKFKSFVHGVAFILIMAMPFGLYFYRQSQAQQKFEREVQKILHKHNRMQNQQGD